MGVTFITLSDSYQPSLKRALRRAGVLLVLFLILLLVIFAMIQFRATTQRVETDARRSAHVVATHFQWLLQSSSQALRRIEDGVGDPELHEGEMRIINIRDAVRDLPPGFAYGVYDERGNLRYSSLTNPAMVNVADREYFRSLKAGAEVMISPLVTDRQTGHLAFIVARRLNRGAEFLGVATVAIPEESLTHIAEALGQSPDSVVGLMRMDGMLIARWPAAAAQNYAGTRLFQELRTAPNGAFDAVSAIDGIRRVIGYWTLQDWPVVAFAGVSHTNAYSDLMQLWVLGAIFTLPFLALFWFFLHRLNLQVERENRHAQDVAEANERAQFLLREIHHRVKNNLQSVISLIRLERVPAEVKSRILSRIGTMIELHEEMYKTDQPQWISLQSYIPRLVNRIAAGNGRPARLDVQVEAIILPGERAMVLGLLLNELITNAYKHAFPQLADPVLTVRLYRPSPGRLRLTVRDNGEGGDGGAAPDGHAVLPDSGMGKQLVRAFSEQLGGDLRFDRQAESGLTVVVEFPETIPR